MEEESKQARQDFIGIVIHLHCLKISQNVEVRNIKKELLKN